MHKNLKYKVLRNNFSGCSRVIPELDSVSKLDAIGTVAGQQRNVSVVTIQTINSAYKDNFWTEKTFPCSTPWTTPRTAGTTARKGAW